MVSTTKCPYFGACNKGGKTDMMRWSGVCHDKAILGASDPQKNPFLMNYSATLSLIIQTLLVSGPGWPLSVMEDEGDSDQR